MLNEMRHWKTTIAVCSGPNSKITLRLRYYELFDIEFQRKYTKPTIDTHDADREMSKITAIILALYNFIRFSEVIKGYANTIGLHCLGNPSLVRNSAG